MSGEGLTQIAGAALHQGHPAYPGRGVNTAVRPEILQQRHGSDFSRDPLLRDPSGNIAR